MVTSRAKDCTFIFSMITCRCALIVRSVLASSRAACLFVLPRTMISKTCRWRGVSVHSRARSASNSPFNARAVSCRAIALSSAFSSSSEFTGLVKKLCAPALMAFTVTVMSV